MKNPPVAGSLIMANEGTDLLVGVGSKQGSEWVGGRKTAKVWTVRAIIHREILRQPASGTAGNLAV